MIEVSISHLLSVFVPAVLALVGWMTWISKVLWEIRTEVSERVAHQDATVSGHETRISQLEDVVYGRRR